MADQQKLNLWKNKAALVSALEKIPFFDSLEPDEMSVLINFMSLYQLEPGEYLFKEGEMGTFVSFVVEGTVDIMKQSITGAEIVITSVSQGYAIGEMSLIDRSRRSATVKARNHVELAVLAQNGFRLILEKHPAIGIKILIGFAKFQTENLRKTSSRLNAYTHLMATMCKQTGKEMPHDLEKHIAKDEENRVRETHSISSLSTSKKIFTRLKKLLTKEIF
ncbi:MAG: cyclic nucleotide-binding domain-containing protein [Proteobacteria bacterium]|nr:cyclic nucleotide-binding domain-containing protein [Pseudomonadota bacterium]MBU1736521.1 cyclic nucleotide-binding domain-containing protein [Pseudomonadota bacterium]